MSSDLLATNVLQLPEWRDIYHKTLFENLMFDYPQVCLWNTTPAFWVGAVMRSAFISHSF